MTSKASEKIIDALTQLMEGFAELQESLENDFPPAATDADDDAEDTEVSTEIDEGLVNEMRTSIEAVVESEDFSPEEFAAVISTMTDALQEIDPDIFADEDDDDDEDEEEYDEDEDEDDEELEELDEEVEDDE